MARMLIVDDERIDREGVAYLLRKYGFPIETCMAESVDEALAVLQRDKVDILFTDVCMPDKSGLELVRLARERYPELACVVYSAFGEFEYAKQAMQYGVRHYILKPLKLEEFQDTIQAVLEDCEKSSREQQREEILRLLLLGDVPADSHWEATGLTALVEFSSPLFADNQYDAQGLLEQRFAPAIVVNLNEYQAVILSDKSMAPLEMAAKETCRQVEKETGNTVTIVLGERVTTPRELLQVYGRLDSRLDAKFFGRGSQVLSTGGDGGGPGGDYQEKLQEVEACIQRRDKQQAIAEVEVLFQELEQGGALSPMYVKYIGVNLVHGCCEVNTSLTRVAISRYVERLFHCPDIYALKDALEEILDEALPAEDGESGGAIRRVLAIIETEYMYDISLEQIADRVGLSPSYLSYYFKKETGRNFIKYLTVYRLEKAKELLRHTDTKVITVAEKVGYLNSSYFCLLFKNYTGMTPARYREESTC